MTTTINRPADLNPSRIISKIRTNPAFIEEMGKPGTKVTSAFSKSAETLMVMEVTSSDTPTIDGYGYKLAGQLNNVVGSIVALDSGRLTREGTATHKDKLIDFNHDLRAMIDNYPDLTPADIQLLLVQTYIAAHRSEWADEEQARAQVRIVADAIDKSLYGMWSEVCGELVVAEAGYEIDSAVTNTEERKGIDAWVLMRPELGDDGWMPIDFKGSAEKAQKTNRSNDGNYAVWSQFGREEYSPRKVFRIPPERIRAKAPQMRRDLENLYGWYTR